MFNNKKILVASSVVVAMLATTGCQRKIGGNQYNSASLNGVAYSYQGVIVSVRTVQVSESERLQDNQTGIGAGALAGGLAGSAIGNGNGSLAAMGIGAILGGIGGAFAQDAMGSQDATEYTVKLSNGNILTAVQQDEQPLAAGQRVFVSVPTTANGRPRVMPDNTNSPMDVQQMQPVLGQTAPSIVINNSR